MWPRVREVERWGKRQRCEKERGTKTESWKTKSKQFVVSTFNQE